MKQNEFIESLKQKITIDTKNMKTIEEEKDNIENLTSFIESRIQLQMPDLTQAKVDIGSGVFIDVQINNPSTIIVNIGLDIYAEVPLSIALGILSTRYQITLRKLNLLYKELSKNNAYLKLTEDLSKQLNEINVKTP